MELSVAVERSWCLWGARMVGMVGMVEVSMSCVTGD